jgi:hypothetical protein
MVLYDNMHEEDFRRKVTLNLSADGTQLQAYCCDLGPVTNKFWESAGIEFTLVVKGDAMEKLQTLVDAGEAENLVPVIAKKFTGKECFSDLKDFLDEHQVKYEFTVWR